MIPYSVDLVGFSAIYNNMKKLSFLFVMVCAPISCLAGVECRTIGGPVYCTWRDADGNYVNTTTYNIGNSAYTTGHIGDDKIWTSSNNFGGTVHISGSVGDKRVRVSKNNIGTRSYISGKIGNAGIRASVNKIGTKNYTTGSVGGRPVSVISNTFGGKTSYNF